MIINNIPKEFRQSTKVDTSYPFVCVSSPLFYISIRRKSDNEEVKFFMLKGVFTVDVNKLISSFDFEVTINLIFDSRNDNRLDYSLYYFDDYKSVDYIKEGV